MFDHVVCGHVGSWHVSLVSQDHMLVGLLGLLVLSSYFDLELVILCLCMMSRTASTTPTTLSGLVKKAQDINRNWRMFTGPMKPGTSRLGQCRPNIRALEENPDMEINAFQGKCTLLKKRGKLTPAERKHHMDNNLCLYCGKPGHKASECTAPPNRFPRPPNTSIRRIDAIPEEEPQAEKSDINMIDSNQFGILASLDPSEMNVTSDF